MLRREELLRGAKGALGAPAGRGDGQGPYLDPEGPPLKERHPPRRGCSGGGGRRPGWQHRRRGRTPSFPRAHGRHHYYYYYYDYHHSYHQQAKPWPRCPRPRRPRVMLSLRPANVLGLRAPRNTNQFLMREKYQLLHLRSDSVGTESGGSDGEMDPLDLDAYLGVLENARGALLDGPAAPLLHHDDDAPHHSAPRPPDEASPEGCPSSTAPGLAFPRGGLEGALQEESLPYFPSEDDVLESERFMERDFHEFCSRLA